MGTDRISRAGQMLAKAWREGRTVDAYPAELAPADVAEATAIQEAMAAAIDEPIVGWKVAGRPGAPCGRIFASTAFASGVTLPLKGFARPYLECEVGFKLSADLPPRAQAYTAGEVAAAADMAINIELVGTRYTDGKIIPDTDAERYAIVADNAAQVGLVTGPVITEWQGLSLLDIGVDLRIDGGPSLPLMDKDKRTEPFDVLLWTANHLSERGIGLAAGQIVTPGSVTVPTLLPQGSTAVARFDDLGEITVSLAAG